jgi:hypothetical protein
MRDQMTSNRDSGLTAPPRIGSGDLLGSFPSDRKKTIIEVFQQKGDPAFICGVDGWIVGHVMEAIEKDINENRDEDEKDGRYLYEISYSEAQTGDEGRIELPAYWDLREIAFEPNVPR